MAESHVLSALKRRYGQALGMLRGEPAQAKADLAHLTAVIRMFNPAEDLAAIPPIRPYKANRERWNRTVLNILKAADRPLKAMELARLVLVAHGIDPTDQRRLFSISCSLQAVLGRLTAKGLVGATGKPRRWAIAGRDRVGGG
ncbi:hypothetical protein [Phenylobacterium sp.]|uniref:hypothetical protein n=1 Tax=Phenylobacterium sp. TaxID=1871053 RepID=UPI002FC86965